MDDEKQMAPPAPLAFSIESLWRRVLSKKVKETFTKMNKGLGKKDGVSKEG